MATHGSSGASPQSQDVWDVLGRDTAVGKALYNVYCGDTTRKQYGKQARIRNKIIQERTMAASSRSPTPVPPPAPSPKKPQVKVPKCTGKTAATEDAAGPFDRPQRKPATVIQEEMIRNTECMLNQKLPSPARPLLDDREKERLAQLMQHRGKVPVLSEEELRIARQQKAAKGPKSRLEELQAMFDSIQGEIMEREGFLDSMQRLQRSPKDYAHVKVEIGSRLKELERVDNLIREEEGLCHVKH